MSTVTLTLNISDDGTIEVLDQAATSLNEVADAANLAGEALSTAGDEAEASGSSFGESAASVGKFGGQIMATVGVMTMAGGLIDSMANAGIAIQRTDLALNTLTNGNADAWMKQAADATMGLVDDATLASAAVSGLTSGVIYSSDQFSQLAHDATILGETLGSGAGPELQKFETTLEQVGNQRGVRQLGLDSQAIMTEYNTLVSEGIDKTTAWGESIMGVANATADGLQSSVDKAGGAWDRLTTKVDNFMDNAKSNFATGVDGMIGLFDTLTQHVELVGPALEAMSQQMIDIVGQSSVLQALMGPAGLLAAQEYNAKHQSNISAPDQNGISYWQGANALPTGQADQFEASLSALNDYVASLPTDWTTQTNINGSVAGGGSWGGISGGMPALGDTGSASTGGSMPVYITNPDSLTNPLLRAATGSSGPSMMVGPQAYGDNYGQFMGDVGGMTPLQYSQELGDAFSGLTPIVNDAKTFIGALGQSAQETAKAQTSLAAAFGLGGTGIAREVGGTFDQGLAAGRQAIITRDQATWQGRQHEQADLQAYDQQAAEAKNQYMIATGQATQASLLFTSAENEAAQALAAGKINAGQYAAELLALTNAANQGYTSLSALETIQNKMSIQEITAADPKKGAMWVHHQGMDQPGAGTDGATDAASSVVTQASKIFDPLNTASQSAANLIDAVGVHAQALPGVLSGPMEQAATQVNKVQTAAEIAYAALQALLKVNGAVTVQVSSNVSPGVGQARVGVSYG